MKGFLSGKGFKVLMDLIRLTGGAEVPEQKGWWF